MLSSDGPVLRPQVIIPAYQAERTVRRVVQLVGLYGLPVLVVDDASSDATALEARAAGARVLTLPINRGKGNALRRGFELALREGHDWVLTLDADGQHLPSEIPHFLEVAGLGHHDLILGNRMGAPAAMPWDRRLTNRFMSWLISRITRRWIPDSQCGFRMISARVLRGVELTADRYEIETELAVKAVWAGFRTASIPVSSIYRRETSFIRPLRDTVRFLLLLRTLRRWRRERIFGRRAGRGGRGEGSRLSAGGGCRER